MNTQNSIIEKCFICYKKHRTICNAGGESSSSSVKGDNDEAKVLRKQRVAVFLLKKFFSIPEETFCQFQQQYGNPSSWIYWCDSCSVLVDEAKNLFDQIQLLERRINVLKQELESKITSSRKREEYPSKIVKTKDEPTEIVRTLIVQEIFSSSKQIVKLEKYFEDNENLNSDVSNAGDNSWDDDSDDGELGSSLDTENKFKVKNPVELSGLSKLGTKVKNSHQQKKTVVQHKSLNIPLPKYANCKDNFQICPVCSKSCSTKQEWYKHLLTHPPPCPFCTEQFLDGKEYKSHVVAHKRKDDPMKFIKCSVCYEDFKSFTDVLLHKCKLVVYHVKLKTMEYWSSSSSSEESSLECPVCEEEFVTLEDLKVHQKIHEKIFPCPQCNRSFRVAFRLKEHLLTHADPEGKPFKCQTCGKGFVYKLNLRYHENLHRDDWETNPYRCTVCGKNLISSFGLSQHLKIHSRENKNSTVLCTICGKSISKSLFKRHEKMHSGIKPHVCGVCGAKFTIRAGLVQHSVTHTDERLFVCSFCEKKFKYQTSLKIHLRTHTGELPPHKCPTCDKRFTTNHGLKSHQRSHSGEKPYACQICGFKFAYKSNLTDHERIHTGELPFACSYCEARFRYPRGLKIHLRSHTGEPPPHKCSFCDKRFNSLESLRNHERTHTGEKPYSCNYCGRGFARQSQRRRHVKVVHENVPKRFACSICAKLFHLKSDRQRHERTHYK